MTLLLQAGNAFAYRRLLEDEKLSRDNFLNWYEKLQIVLSNEGKLHMMKTSLPNPPTIFSTKREIYAYEAAVTDEKDIARMILNSVHPELRSSLMGCTVFGMLHTIQDMYKGKAFKEIIEFMSMLQTGNTSAGVRLSSDVLKDYMERLDRFGSQMLNNNVIESIMKVFPIRQSEFSMADWDMVLSNLKLVIVSSDYKYLPKVGAVLLRSHDIKPKRWLTHIDVIALESARAKGPSGSGSRENERRYARNQRMRCDGIKD